MARTQTFCETHEWWQCGVVYQIYPRSFMDANGDGVGDLAGIIDKLDYIQWLGVDAIWLSPIYPSPMADFGYDISDYCDVHPLFGSLADFDRLLSEAHRRGLKVILDFVPNHTSDEHPWFIESKASRESAKRDWYIWRDGGAGGGEGVSGGEGEKKQDGTPSPLHPLTPPPSHPTPPNNWLSNFGGPAWKFDETTRQYYFHAFLNKQPDLNWRNPEVQQAMFNVLRFWLDRGVDGFRIDVIYHIVKDDQFRDNPRNPDYKPGSSNPHHEFLATYIADRPEVHDIIAGMRKVIDEYDSRMLVGEIYLPVERLVMYYGDGGRGVHMPFNFQLITMAWNAGTISNAIQHYEGSLPEYGWPNWVLGNHDNPRIASRVGRAQARVAAMMLLTLRGTPTMYYGDEIGMTDVPIPKERVQDPFEKNVPGMGLGRDPERTPMQWDSSAAAGFTREGVEPWLPIDEADLGEFNVVAQRERKTSTLALYRRLIELRRAEPALNIGAYEGVSLPDDVGDLIAYVRHHAGRRFLIVLNLGAKEVAFPRGPVEKGRIVLSTFLDREDEVTGESLKIRGNEGVVIALK